MSLRHRNTHEYRDPVAQPMNPDPAAHPMNPSNFRRRLIVKIFLLLTFLAISILTFGTVYSNMTSRDPCHVLRDFSSDDNPPKELPRLFHFQSKTRDLTKETKSWMKVLEMHPTIQEYPNIKSDSASVWTAVYWSDDSCKKLVQDHFPKFLHVFDSYPHNIQRVDSCRYLILYMYGGVYADTDISFHATDATEFELLLRPGVGLVESPYRYNEIYQNSLMTASSPGHVFWNITIEIMVERKRLNEVLSSTGPKMIGDAVNRFIKSYDRGNVEIQDVHTLPCELFQRLPVGNWDTTFLNIIAREVLARAIPMKGCGRYGNGICEITRHSGRASWTNDAGIT